MLHRERELRARMRWVVIVFATVLVVGVISLVVYVQTKRPSGPIDDFRAARQKAQSAR